jgi:hypothetical protein
VSATAAWILSKIVSTIMLGWLNHLGGALLGLIIAGVLIGSILAIWVKYGSGGNTISNSLIGSILLAKLSLVMALLPGEFDTILSYFS